MLKLKKLAAGVAAAAAVAVVASSVPALADPPVSGGKAVVPKPYDVVGVGANTDDGLFNQLALDYNKTIPASKHNAKHPYLYSFNATKPGSTSTSVTKIVPKAGCKSTIRPNGSKAGLATLDENTLDGTTGHFCVDFTRSSSGRSPTSPKPGPGGDLYVALAEDAVTYATRDTGVTHAPKSLTLAQLQKIFLCTDTNWSQVGGKPGAIKAYLPQTGSGTLSFWLKTLGITAAGSCVNGTLEENQGLSKQFNNPNAIFIYSVADWIAQKYHSAACSKKPTKAQNQFGCDQVGFLGLDKIDGVSPITAAKIPIINKGFASTGFTRTIYDVVRWTKATPDHILSRIDPFFAARARHGFICSNATATKTIAAYGFLPTPLCGSGS